MSTDTSFTPAFPSLIYFRLKFIYCPSGTDPALHILLLGLFLNSLDHLTSDIKPPPNESDVNKSTRSINHLHLSTLKATMISYIVQSILAAIKSVEPYSKHHRLLYLPSLPASIAA
ncbi:hypothetical protein DSO57_1035924 [Entomophthora muscae]|uniref:Uncharacterized protein n=1 Tax=Entomophthora muscae TaxID=34485 RepID=A0ACC2U908_9FUNG|nr:hypothetical protein DSO57_1035924 [Entomophthora muscae]